MATLYDITYWIGLSSTAPVWMLVPKWREKVLNALGTRDGRDAHLPGVGWEAASGRPASPRGDSPAAGPTVLIHAVSLGEVNATRTLVAGLREALAARVQINPSPGPAGHLSPYGERGKPRFVITTTTTAGYKAALRLYGNDADCAVSRFPLDFSSGVARLLDRTRPDVVVLMELELWPNFMRMCERRGVPVVVVNGRMTPYSARHYRWLGPVGRRMFGRAALVCVQDADQARRFVAAGVRPERVRTTGTMKFDTAEIGDVRHGAGETRSEVGEAAKIGNAGQDNSDVEPVLGGSTVLGGSPVLGCSSVRGCSTVAREMKLEGARLWVCGSTGPGEEAMVLDAFALVRKQHPDVKLVIVPRKPERFNEVADLIASRSLKVARRTKPASWGDYVDVVLVDTLGELRKFYALASAVFVGRSLVDLGSRQAGSDMIEPAALGKAVVVGPFTANFADAMARFVEAKAIIDVATKEALAREVTGLLSDPKRAAELGAKARAVVIEGKGATQRHVEAIVRVLSDGRR